MSKIHRTELSEYEKGQINALNRVGLNAMQISKQNNQPHQTIMNFLKREKERLMRTYLDQAGQKLLTPVTRGT